MLVQLGPRFLGLILGAALLALVLLLAWAALPEELRGFVVLFGGVASVALYVLLYVVERRRHW